MTMNFPSSPSNGDVFTNSATGIKYTFSTAKGAWETLQFPTNASHVPLSGGTMTGNLSLGTNDLTVGDVTASGSVQTDAWFQSDRTDTNSYYLLGQTNGTEKARIKSDGSASFASGNTAIDSAGTITVSRDTDGQDVFQAYSGGTRKVLIEAGGTAEFSGAVKIGGTAAANEMDEYEEGTWTPQMTGSTSGTASGYNQQFGGYIKVGNLVHLYGYLALSNRGNIAGKFRLSNFPFPTRNDTGYFHAPAIGWYANISTVTAYGVGIDIPPGHTYGTIVRGNGSAASSLDVSEGTDNFSIEWTFTYRTS